MRKKEESLYNALLNTMQTAYITFEVFPQQF